jgi:hypothetical protein
MELLRNVNKAHSNKINNSTDWDCLLTTHIPQPYPSTNTNHIRFKVSLRANDRMITSCIRIAYSV